MGDEKVGTLGTAVFEIIVGVGLALLIGAEREFYRKAAGMRTCALVGLGATLFTVVSRHGHWLLPGMTVTNVDGSRVAAQIVSGIGFLGAGLIFVRRDAVRGLTTAAGIWFVAAVGMAAGAGLPDVAAAATLVYLVVVIGIRPLTRVMPHSRSTFGAVDVTYADGQGVLRTIMETIGAHGVHVGNLHVIGQGRDESGRRLQSVRLNLSGATRSVDEVIRDLAAVEGVTSLSALSESME